MDEYSIRQLRSLVVANHVLYNLEYKNILTDQVHYLMGRNEQAVNLVTSDTEHTYEQAQMSGLADEPLQAAELLVLFGAIVSIE